MVNDKLGMALKQIAQAGVVAWVVEGIFLVYRHHPEAFGGLHRGRPAGAQLLFSGE